MKISRISPNELKRIHYISANELAKEIADYVKKHSKAVSLATDYRWWAKNLVNPHEGHVLNVSIGYEGDFLEDELIYALRKQNVNVNLFLGESWFYIVQPKLI